MSLTASQAVSVDTPCGRTPALAVRLLKGPANPLQVFGRIHRRNREIEDHIDAVSYFLKTNGY